MFYHLTILHTAPTYLRDAILLLKQHQEQDVIVFGNTYLIDLGGMRLFRIIKRHEQSPDLLCLTTNQPSVFGDIVVPWEQVSGLWVGIQNIVRIKHGKLCVVSEGCRKD